MIKGHNKKAQYILGPESQTAFAFEIHVFNY